MRWSGKAIAAGLAAAIFVIGLAHLARQRLGAGWMYPEGSSLRADPKGTMALYEALGGLEGVTASRNYRPAGDLTGQAGTTLLYLWAGSGRGLEDEEPSTRPATRPASRPSTRPASGPSTQASRPFGHEDSYRQTADNLALFASQGGRLVIAVARDASPGHPQLEAMLKLLGAKLEPFAKLYGASAAIQAPGAPEPWALYLADLKPPWRVCLECRGHAVVAQRPFGAGTVVLAADSYFLSNQALRAGADTRLLASLVGGPRVVFDEHHLGVTEKDGTVTLARRYGLSWLGGALLVLAVLYVWKAHATLVPRRTDEPAGGRVLAAPEAPGRPLVRLMRAGTSPAAALRACVEEFERSQAGQTAGQAARQQVRQLAGSAITDQEAVEAFGRICEQVNRKRTMT
jgi:hypothetical protein